MMSNQNDDELKEIRKRKLQELVERRNKTQKEEKQISMPIVVTDTTLPQILRKYPLVVVDCWAEWCQPCRIIAPLIDELAKEYAGKIVFGKLNVDENQDTTMKYKIMAIPTLLIFKNGNLIDRVTGALPREMLEPIIREHM